MTTKQNTRKRSQPESNADSTGEPYRKKPKIFDPQSITAIQSNIFNTISDKSLHDVTFQIVNENGLDNSDFTGIKYLFAAQSLVFKNMLHGHMKESSSENNVIIEDISSIAFSHIREYCHMSKPEIQYQDICDVLYASQKYMITNLVKICHDQIMEINNINDFFIVMKAFNKYAPVTFQPFIDQFARQSNFVAKTIEQIVRHEDFYQLKTFQVQSILKSEKLKNSYDVAKAYCIHHNKGEEWKNMMTQYFTQCIDFSWLKSLYLFQTVRNDKVLPETKLLDALAEKKMNKIKCSGFTIKNISLPHNEFSDLKRGQTVDFQDETGQFVLANVKDKNYNGSEVTLQSSNNQIKLYSYKKFVIAYLGSVTNRIEIKKPCMKVVQNGSKVYVNFKYIKNVNVDKWTQVRIQAVERKTYFKIQIQKGRNSKTFYINADSHDECACCKYCKFCKIFWE